MTLIRKTGPFFCCLFAMTLTLSSAANGGGGYDYKVVYKKCALEALGDSSLFITGATAKSTVKIRALKKQPTAEPKDGVLYFSGQSIPSVRITGNFRSFFSEAPVGEFSASGVVRSLTMMNSHAEEVQAQDILSLKMTAFMNDAEPTPTYAWTSIETDGTASTRISLTGVILKNLNAPQWRYYPSSSLYWQPPATRVTVKVASKAWKNAIKQKFVSLSGVGRVTPGNEEIGKNFGVFAIQIRTLSAKGASIAPDVLLSGLPISTLKAQSASLDGIDYPGHVGLPDAWLQTLVLAPDIQTVYGAAGVAAKFWAGFDVYGHATYEGGVKSIGTKKGVGALSGEVHMSTEAKPTKFKPDQGAFRIVAKEPGVDDRLIETTSVFPSVFTMGSREGEVQMPDELPRHEVALSAYEIGLYEFTVGQACELLNWAYAQGLLQNGIGTAYDGGAVYGYNSALVAADSPGVSILFSSGSFAPAVIDGRSMHSYPVGLVSWNGAIAFCNWLSEIEGLTACYDLATMDAIDASDITDGLQFHEGYRLPTEAEWERAAAWDGTRHWIYGFQSDSIATDRCNYMLANPMGFTNDPFTSPVGWYNGANGTVDSPSPVGCYDMSGNVAELCYDWIDFYTAEPQKNPTGPALPSARIIRGGVYLGDGSYCRTAWRSGDGISPGIGFRMARSR